MEYGNDPHKYALERKAVRFAMHYENNYRSKGKSLTDFAADYQVTNDAALTLINIGKELMK